MLKHFNFNNNNKKNLVPNLSLVTVTTGKEAKIIKSLYVEGDVFITFS